MYAFSTVPRARLLCRADFATQPWLNIDFVDPARDEIPFHLSLRRDQGLAVVNRRHKDGWRREIVFALPPSGAPVEIDIAFAAGGVVVRLDGRRLGRFDALPRPSRAGKFLLRRGFPGLNRIARLELDGDLVAGSLQLTCTGLVPAETGCRLTPRLELEIDLPDGDAVPGVVLVDTAGPLPPLVAPVRRMTYTDAAGGPRHAACAILPGRLWAGGAATLDLVARAEDGGTLAATRLDRNGLLAALKAAAEAGLWRTDMLAVLNAVEHVRHAGLWPELPAGLQQGLAQTARGRGLLDWLTAGQSSPAAAPPPPAKRPVPNPVEAARQQIVAALRDGADDALALARAALSDPALAQDRRHALLRNLAEPFCATDRMPALAALARDLGLLPLPEGDSAWDQSTALPFDLAQGWFDAIEQRLVYLASLDDGWPVTPVIAWTVRQVWDLAPALDGQRPTLAEHRRITRGWMRYLDSLREDYWSRAPCAELIGAMVHLLSRPDRLRPDMLRACATAAVRLWGLTPRFWAALGDLALADLPALMAEAAVICADLQREAEAASPDHARIDALLARAEGLRIADALRFRRELLGPSCLPGGVLDPDALQHRGLDAEETCLRALVHPDAAGLPAGIAEPVWLAATRGLAAAFVQVPTAPLHGLERRLLSRAAALMTDPEPAALGLWARELIPLAGADQGHAGITLGLGLAAGLARGGRPDLAEALLADLPAVAATPGDGIDTRVPTQALAVLARHAPELAVRAAPALKLPAPEAQPADPLLQDANPLHDTLVAVYSCRANLGDRVAQLRDGWLRDLTAMGIPWLVFTGDGDGTRQGDTVHLDAPDDYEGLPDKTLAMVRWVLGNTRVSRLLKVDDDCFLHAEAWFGDLAHLRHHYLGRPLALGKGQMNRTWHMAKSRTDRGRMGLDKSPEPARYADGGSGYMLSRAGMAALVAAADSPEGRQLRQISFMEDKQTGDLLAMQGIAVSGEDYRTGVWRRTGPGGPLVPAWENGVLPFRGSPVKLAHLDDSLHQARARDLSRRPLPQPGKVWPSFQPALLGNRTNTLDLLSPPSRLARVRAAPVAVVACLRNEAAMVPAFLDHYRRLGVEGFLIADNGSDDGTLELLAQAPDVALFAVDTEYSRSQYGVAWQQALMANFRPGRWSLVADADEFLVWSDDPAARLPDLLAGPDFAGADAARVLMLDMYPQGPLSSVTLASGDPIGETGFVDHAPFLRVSAGRGPFSDAETLTSALRHRLIPGSRPELFVAQKYALLRYRPWMRLSAGLHFVAGIRPAARDLLFAHVKYTAAFRAKALAEVQRRQHFNDAEEYRKYLALLAEGREVLFDPAVSVPWRDCAEVRRILSAGVAPVQGLVAAR